MLFYDDGYIVAPIFFKLSSSSFLVGGFITTLIEDLRKKNKNINITPTNVYLINFSYFTFSFLVNFFIKLFFSLLFYVFVFFKINVFYYQSIYFVLLENFLFALTVSIIEIFISFFCFKFLKIVKTFLVFIYLFSFLILTGLARFIPIFFRFIRFIPTIILMKNQDKAFLSILGLKKFFYLHDGFVLETIGLSIILFLMFFVQNVFVFVYNEKKFNSK